MTEPVSVSVILPTFNERGSMEHLIPRLEQVLSRYDHELIVVDDASADGTAELVEELDPGIPWVLIRRSGRLGLASAVLDGIARSRAPVVAVMDSDGSHPPGLLPALIDPVVRGDAEMVIASRRLPGGGDDGQPGARRALSWGASLLARPLTDVSDSMSGFFAVDRRIIDRAALAPVGYKIALEMLVKCRPDPLREIPYRFAPRLAGESKLGGTEVRSYVRHLGRLYVWRVGPLGRASRTR
jgi:glycosyltransferase involved in cell wall biosynthesis